MNEVPSTIYVFNSPFAEVTTLLSMQIVMIDGFAPYLGEDLYNKFFFLW